MERPGSGAGFGIASASISVAGLRCFDPVLESDFDFSSSSVLLNALADFSLPLPRSLWDSSAKLTGRVFCFGLRVF